jgi:hypothetical protein
VIIETLSAAEPALSVSSWFRLTAVVLPQSTAQYTFMVSAGGVSRLWLTADLNQPGNAAVIASTANATAPASWNEQTSQLSASLTLEKDRPYYLELQGHGPHFSVGVKVHRVLFNARDIASVSDEVQVRCYMSCCRICRWCEFEVVLGLLI